MFGRERDVDPFNAGEPEPMDGSVVDDSDEAYGAHGSGDEPHKMPDDYAAPTTDDSAYDAPSIENDVTSRRAFAESYDNDDDEGGSATPTGNGRGCLIGCLVTAIVFGQLILGLVSCTVSFVSDALDDGAADVETSYSVERGTIDW